MDLFMKVINAIKVPCFIDGFRQNVPLSKETHCFL